MEGDRERDANCTNFQEFLEINSGPQTGRKTKMHRQNMRLGGTDPFAFSEQNELLPIRLAQARNAQTNESQRSAYQFFATEQKTSQAVDLGRVR